MPRPHRIQLLVFLVLLLSAAFTAASAQASTNEATILQDDSHVLSDPVGTLATLRSIGVTEVRIFIPWGALTPNLHSRRRPGGFDASNPGAYSLTDWAPYDAAVRAASADGIGVDFDFLGPAPLWATSRPPRGVHTDNPNVYDPSAQQFGEFVRAVGRRYGGSYTPRGATSPLPKVRFWGIWNEPNYGPDLQPQVLHGVASSPAIYRGLLSAAWSALHATGHGSDTILIGETAPRGGPTPGIAGGTYPLRFLRGLYCVSSGYQELRGTVASAQGCPTSASASRRFRSKNPALFSAGGFAAHMYTLGQVAPPNRPSASNEPDYAGLADLPKLERTLDRLNRTYGSHKKLPLYNTEFGFQTNPPGHKCGCVFLSPAKAAYYMNWSEYLMWSNPRVRSYSQYLLEDDALPGHPSESGFASGLFFSNGTPKPSYDAFRLPLYLPSTSAQPGHSLTVWGGVRPAPFAKRDTGSAQQVQIQFLPSGGTTWTTLSTVTISNSAGYFKVSVTFPSSGSVMLQWTYPSTFSFLPIGTPPTVTSRIQTVTVS